MAVPVQGLSGVFTGCGGGATAPALLHAFEHSSRLFCCVDIFNKAAVAAQMRLCVSLLCFPI